jgi:TPR repeat protein
MIGAPAWCVSVKRSIKAQSINAERPIMRMRILLVVLFSLSTSGTSYADDRGLEAYKAGDYARAMNIWRPLAEKGKAQAQYQIGNMLDHGLGGRVDHAEARIWYRKAADQKNADAQFALAESLMHNRVMPNDPAEAVGWYRKVAAQGHLTALLRLATAYRDGNGVAADIVMAHVFASIHTKHMGKMDLGARIDMSKELAARLADVQLAESEELQLQGAYELSRLPLSSKTWRN